MPTRSATSEVMGVRLARPRMPSVPKYLRAMKRLVGSMPTWADLVASGPDCLFPVAEAKAAFPTPQIAFTFTERPPKPPAPGGWRQHRARAGAARPGPPRGGRLPASPAGALRLWGALRAWR